MLLRRLAGTTILTLLACSGPAHRGPERPEAADYTRPVVLLVSPDSQEVARLRERLGDDFPVVADDAMWYRAAAVELLDGLGIPHVEVRRGAARFLVGGRSTRVSWEGVERPWFSLVYDGRSLPRVSADVDLPERVERPVARPGP